MSFPARGTHPKHGYGVRLRRPGDQSSLHLFWLTVGAPTMTREAAVDGRAAAAFLLSFYLCLLGAKVLLAILVGRSRHLLGSRGYLLTVRLRKVQQEYTQLTETLESRIEERTNEIAMFLPWPSYGYLRSVTSRT